MSHLLLEKMSLTIHQIITDAKRLAGRLKERDNTADLLINDCQAVIRKVNELKQVLMSS